MATVPGATQLRITRIAPPGPDVGTVVAGGGEVDCCVVVSAIVDIGGEVEVGEVAGGVVEVGDEDAEVAGDEHAPQAGWQPAEQ